MGVIRRYRRGGGSGEGDLNLFKTERSQMQLCLNGLEGLEREETKIKIYLGTYAQNIHIWGNRKILSGKRRRRGEGDFKVK